MTFPHISDVAFESRGRLTPIVDQSFHGIYRWHARRILRSVTWVRQAAISETPIGLTMSTMIAPDLGYLYYIAVIPSARSAGVGGLLLDDALVRLQSAGAWEVLACVREDNTASLRLLESRSFAKTTFRGFVRSKGFLSAARLWVRMVVAPGEQVFQRTFPP
jgi:ribosomal protein S18 acetylase RimI-like enzyme